MVGIRSFNIILLMGMSALIKGKCLNDKPTTIANDFLISKWKMWYKALDVNHDGIVSMGDVEKSGKKFSALEHLDAEKAKIATEAFTKYWNECIFLAGKGDILEHEFVDTSQSYFNANTEEYVKERHRCIELMMFVTDINADKLMSKKELQTFHTAFGHSKLAKDDDYFSAYDPKDGLIPLCDVVDILVDFTSSTNESNGNILKSGYDIDGFE